MNVKRESSDNKTFDRILTCTCTFKGGHFVHKGNQF